MLVLSRKEEETIIVGGSIRITIVSVKGNRVQVGITAPKDVHIVREELIERDRQRNLRVVGGECSDPTL